MNRETLELLVILGMCFVASYLLMREFRAYLNAVFSRVSGESWVDVWRRAHVEHELNRKARLEMFGSKWATVGGRVFVMVLVAAGGWLLVFLPVVALLLVAYMAWGLYATGSLGLTANDVYSRLLRRDRFTYRLLHAALWPLHMAQAKNQSGNQ
jgi:hypothetical protein